MSQADAARALSFTEGMVSNFLSGKTKNPIRKTILKIADYFTCNADWLATGAGEPFSDITSPAPPSGQEPLTQDAGVNGDVDILREIDVWGDKATAGNVGRKLDDMVKAELMRQTSDILDSETVYQPALISNIRAFHHGVKREENMKSRDDMMLQMMNMMKDLQEQNKILSERLGIVETEKKRASNDI